MATQTTGRARPLNVVLRPSSPAERAYRSAVLAPGFEPEPGLDLRYFGGRTLSDLAFTTVFLGHWHATERSALDTALAAAMADAGLNEIIAQYFPGETIGAAFDGPREGPHSLPARVGKDTIESFVAELDRGGGLAGLDLARTAVCLLLPRGVVLVDGAAADVDAPDSEHGLGGYHGSVHVSRRGRRRETVYYAVAVYSEDGNGIVAFEHPWQNVCATLYHELQEVRTDPDVEDAIRARGTPAAAHLLGWYSPPGGEIADIPIAEAHGNIRLVMKEVPLADGSGTVPVQLLWSNRVGGPEAPATS
jgi:hypothetical protein